MPKNVTKLTEDENRYFHLNYDYMWKKLNTAPYYACGAGECPDWIMNAECLPSYVNLSKCRNPEFIPSTTLVNKIVQFYNSNIEPEITTFQFLKENLSLTDADRRPAASKYDERFVGTYYGYYYSESEKKNLVSAIIKIYNINQTLRATIITGIQNEDELYGSKLKKLVSKDYISTTAYTNYKNSLDISQQRTTLYDGSVILTSRFLIIQLQGIDKEHKNLAITLNIESFSEKTPYLSGLSFSVLVSDKFDIQFFMMAISRAYCENLIPISFNEPKLNEILNINKGENERIVMTPRDENKWYELVVENGK